MDREILRPPCAHSGIKCRVAILVVGRAFLWIAQRFVSFADFLELFLGGFVTGVLVWMVFDGQFSVGPLILRPRLRV